MAAVGLGAAVGCVYFLAARLGLALLSQPVDVAVFWPASGIAPGALIVLRNRGRLAVAAGVLAASVAANMLVDRDLAISTAFGLCNAGEALLAAWLVDRWCGSPFKFDRLRRLWGFFAAAALASALAAAGAALAMQQFREAAALADVWRVWAAAAGLGIVTVTPLVVGLYHLARERTPRGESIEGIAALALLAATSVAIYAAPAGSWLSQVPPAVLFPFILWIAARCRPVFAAAAAFVIAGTLAGASTFHLGEFGGAAKPVPSVQAIMLITSLCTLTLAALFAERRRSEAALMETNERLRLALGGAQLGVWSIDLVTGAFDSDARDGCINGHDPAAPPRTMNEARKCIHPDDLAGLDAAFTATRRGDASCRAEYRVRVGNAAGKGAGPDEIRWVAVEGTMVRDSAGRPLRMLGVTRDITEPKLAEQQKDLLLAELDHRVKNALAVVTAVASRTQEMSGSVAEFVAALDGRIKSMATTHEMLSSCKWQGLSLGDLIARELEPYATGSNVRIDGSDAMLNAEAGQSMAMVVHELVTNAAKYGALSAERGRVSVTWRRAAQNGACAPLVLDWVEADGPAVAPSSRVGYGTSVIRNLIPYELGGAVDLAFAPEGVRCRMEIPAGWLSADNRPAPPLKGSGNAPVVASAAGGARHADRRGKRA